MWEDECLIKPISDITKLYVFKSQAILKNNKFGALTISEGNLFQWSMILCEKLYLLRVLLQ